MAAEPEPNPQLPSPESILHSGSLTREQKIEKLRQMSYDAREMDVASDEGMLGPPSVVGRIHRALRELGAEAGGTDAKQ
jgi:hypothetical protein